MNEPVFVFSAGWRSGSTLMQRLLCSSKEILVWGESGGALNDFSDAFSRYQQMLGPGGKRYRYGFGGNGEGQLQAFLKSSVGEDEWIACMNPNESHIQRALADTLDAIYRRPAQDNGYRRWGVKEVLAGGQTADFLKSIYPEARFIFLVRHPFECVGSIKKRKWMDLPRGHEPIRYFGEHWRRLAEEFRACEFGMKVRYEDLVSDPSVAENIRQFTGLAKIPADFVKTSNANWDPIDNCDLSFFEKRRLKRIVGDEMRQWDY